MVLYVLQGSMHIGWYPNAEEKLFSVCFLICPNIFVTRSDKKGLTAFPIAQLYVSVTS